MALLMMGRRAACSLLVVSASRVVLSPSTAVAQVVAGAPRVSADSVVIVPGAHYRAGPLERWLFGTHYRALWTTPITVPVLSLGTYAGGLRPVERGGSMQTKSLRFKGADGREYVFRSTDKDPSRSLPEDLRGTYADRIVRDLISAAHPGAALVAARLAEAAGILHVTPQLAAMPDDPSLGEFRAEFAGMLGIIEVRPTDDPDDDGTGFAGAKRVVGSERLLERVTEHADETIEAREFLAARLLDAVMGDWDRHPDQWRWARFGDGANDRWRPIPRDRDWALVRLDGAVWSLARFAYPVPQFVSFEPGYPEPIWLTWSARLLDRRFLSELDRPTWDSVATALRRRLSDEAIDDAIRQLPGALAAPSAGYLRKALIARRDHLGDFADRFYAMLSTEVDVHATDESEIVEVARLDDRFTEVTIRQRTKSGAPRTRTWFRRRFDARDTREIRVHLHKGDDRVVVSGARAEQPLVRVVGGGGLNTFVDSVPGGNSAGTRYYDTNAASLIETSAPVDRRVYVAPKTRRGWIDPPRDWGSGWRPVPMLSYTPDVGLFVGAGPLFERYGFRHDPYAYRMSLRAGYAAGANRWRAEYDLDVRRAGSAMHTTVVARLSQLDILRFYGFGNETPGDGSSDYHRVDLAALRIEPMLHVPVVDDLTLDVGGTLRYASTEPEPQRFISTVNPYGSGNFGQLGIRAGFTFDTRDHPDLAKRGVHASVQAAQYPKLWSATGSFGDVRSTVSTYAGAGGRFRPVLALRAGGDRLWGTYPYFDAAFIGGGSTVRGWREQRFAGDASLYGNAELRVFLSRVFLMLPADLGAFGLADAGRVYVTGERSDLWHTGFGGGLWVSFLGRAHTFSVAAARGREGTGFYFRSGMLY